MHPLPRLFRQRFCPREFNFLDDKILCLEDDYLVTGWLPIRPKSNGLCNGLSIWIPKGGVKVNYKFHDDGSLMDIHIDIGLTRYSDKDFNKSKNIIFIDLLLDLIVDRNGETRLVDECELADCLNSGLIGYRHFQIAYKIAESLQAKDLNKNSILFNFKDYNEVVRHLQADQ